MTAPTLLVTGGSGFLGSHMVRRWLREEGGGVVNVDALTYAGSPARLADLEGDDGYTFIRADVADLPSLERILSEHPPELVAHFAAESHVTRGERDAETFHRTNVDGTRAILEAASRAGVRRLVHVSTDEVYGPIVEGAFHEEDKEPGVGRATSHYARSKALADDLVMGFSGPMDVVVVRPTNAFGPWQYPEKVLPRWITRALRGDQLLVWGDGGYVRQWLFAEDLAAAVALVLTSDLDHRVYNIGPRHEPEITNVDLARWLVRHLEIPEDRIVHTAYDRPQHDRRYAVATSRIEALGWKAGDPWAQFGATVDWYRDAEPWWAPLVEEAEAIYEDSP